MNVCDDGLPVQKPGTTTVRATRPPPQKSCEVPSPLCPTDRTAYVLVNSESNYNQIRYPVYLLLYQHDILSCLARSLFFCSRLSCLSLFALLSFAIWLYVYLHLSLFLSVCLSPCVSLFYIYHRCFLLCVHISLVLYLAPFLIQAFPRPHTSLSASVSLSPRLFSPV